MPMTPTVGAGRQPRLFLRLSVVSAPLHSVPPVLIRSVTFIPVSDSTTAGSFAIASADLRARAE